MHLKELKAKNNLSFLTSIFLYTMSLQNCHCLGTRNSRDHASYMRLGKKPIHCMSEFMSRLKMPSWKVLWRKIKREKKKRLLCSSSVHVPYDLETYSQNFDDLYALTKFLDLSRLDLLCLPRSLRKLKETNMGNLVRF